MMAIHIEPKVRRAEKTAMSKNEPLRTRHDSRSKRGKIAIESAATLPLSARKGSRTDRKGAAREREKRHVVYGKKIVYMKKMERRASQNVKGVSAKRDTARLGGAIAHVSEPCCVTG